jgi:hypothetical protein
VKLVLALLCIASSALASPARKHVPDKYAVAAGKAFADAIEAEDKGDLERALALYKTAFEISPHANTAFNTAEIELRRGNLPQAVLSFELYLALAGESATDRKDIEATIAELRTRPATVELLSVPPGTYGDSSLTAYVLVDGDIVRKPGPVQLTDPPKRDRVVVSVPAGRHTIDIVTNLTFASVDIDVGYGVSTHASMAAPPRIDGNLVVTFPNGFHVKLANVFLKPAGDRVVATPGAHALKLQDLSYECPPIKVVAPSNDSIAYVHVTAVEDTWRKFEAFPRRCRKLAIKQHVLVFGP